MSKQDDDLTKTNKEENPFDFAYQVLALTGVVIVVMLLLNFFDLWVAGSTDIGMMLIFLVFAGIISFILFIYYVRSYKKN